MALDFRIRFLLTFIYFFIHVRVCVTVIFPPKINETYDDLSTYDWTSSHPSSELVYRKCYGVLECARLELPLDWSNLSNPNKVILAIARLPAQVPVSDPSFGGTIILNPGGPSGSGVSLMKETGTWLQKIIDDKKRYELLSFDPRGVDHSTPNASCFGDPLSKQVWDLKNSFLGAVDTSNKTLTLKWAAAQGYGDLCAREEASGFGDSSNIRQYMSTALVARDMVELVDKIDTHLQAHLNPTLSRTGSWQSGVGLAMRRLLNVAILAPKKVPLINYWGFSYGSILGNTFASMFPSRIGRMVLDGVCDADDYSTTGWLTNLQDTEEVLWKFYQYCFDGGAACPLFDKADEHPQSIKMRTENFLGALTQNPIHLVHNGSHELITSDEVLYVIFRSLYGPLQYFPALAQIFADLMSGNYTTMIPRLPRIKLPLHQSSDAGEAEKDPDIYRNPVPFPEDPGSEEGLAAAILCGDGDPLTSLQRAEFEKYISTLKSQSPTIGGMWSAITLRCTGWPSILRPARANRFSGPFKSSKSQYDPRAAPILFIGNTADPVTPLRNAHRMAEGHDGSVVLTQDSAGHCSVFSSPSNCTFQVLRRYFDNGELPELGTICKGDRIPWDGKDKDEKDEGRLGEEVLP